MSVQTKDAQVTSTAVEVDTLRVSDRQLTLRTFRQIPRESIFDSSGCIKGEVWGWVNYFWDNNEGDLHAVYQKGNELRRDPIRSDYPYEVSDLYGLKLAEGWKGPSQQITKFEVLLPTERLRKLADSLSQKIEAEYDTVLDELSYDKDRSVAAMERAKKSQEYRDLVKEMDLHRERVKKIRETGQLYIAT